MLKRCVLVLLLLSLLIFMVGCNKFSQVEEEVIDDIQETGANMRKTVLYYVNEYGLLVPVTKEIPWVESIGKSALESLIDSPGTREELADKGLAAPLAEGTKVLGMTVRDGLAKVDFNSEFLKFENNKQEQNAIKSVVYTLTEFPAIEKVSIMINGNPLQNTEEVLMREKINLENVSSDIKDATPVTLYFKGSSKNGNFTYYVPVTRMVKKSDNIIKTAVSELIKGPVENTGLVSVIPQDTKVIDVVQNNNEVEVNFSKEVEGYGGGQDVEQALVNTVVLTVSAFPGVEQVNLKVEGQAGVLPEGTVLDNPILKPLYINPGNI